MKILYETKKDVWGYFPVGIIALGAAILLFFGLDDSKTYKLLSGFCVGWMTGFCLIKAIFLFTLSKPQNK